MKRNRVVITGIGVVAPNGIGLEAFWDSIINARSGIGPITRFDTTGFKSRVAGEVKNFDPLDYIEPELKPKRMARQTQLAYAASMMALADAGLDPNNLELPSPTPVMIGVSSSAIDVLERAFQAVRENGPNRASPTATAHMIPQAAANLVADRIGICADATTVSSACSSGLDAIAQAAAMITSGEAEIAVAGGADVPVTPLALSMFIASGLSSCRNAEPERASRPFDLYRDSGVISEGAGMMILENMARAEARDARMYLEVTSYGKYRDRDPEKPGSGLEDSMSIALANGGLSRRDIDHISAYGTGHPVLDATEVQAIKNVFGRQAYSIPVTSIKGVTGNPMAAAGPFQLAACALTIRDEMIAPTANYEVPDPTCDLDFVVSRPRKAKINCALINVRGLGGSASTMIVSAIERDE
jgi:3-oxoacyl-[acyl-carrier-protein] synthase II